MLKIDFSKVSAVAMTVGSAIVAHRGTIASVVGKGCEVGALVYLIRRGPEAVHEIEDEARERDLGLFDKAAIASRTLWPAEVLYIAGNALEVYSNVRKELDIKALDKENKSLLTQVAELSVAYNATNEIKNAITKKIDPKVLEEVKKEVYPIGEKKASDDNNDIPKKDPKNRMLDYSKEPYVSDPRQLETWNEIFMRTGDTDYKPQMYYIPFFAQKFMSCNHEVLAALDRFDNEVNNDDGDGYAIASDLLSELGCDVPQSAGYYAWYNRKAYTSAPFSYTVDPGDIDGVACMYITFDYNPIHSATRDF